MRCHSIAVLRLLRSALIVLRACRLFATIFLITAFLLAGNVVAVPPNGPAVSESFDGVLENGEPTEYAQKFDESRTNLSWPLEQYAAEGQLPDCNYEEAPPDDSIDFMPKPAWFGLRHSSTHGRNAGIGSPLVGTSWLNRPYYIGGDLGIVGMMNHINEDVTTDRDIYGGIFGGCDWDHYWGTELSIQRATPELNNEYSIDPDRGDRLMIYSASMLYYPWGDAVFRPYWRAGLGATEIDYPLRNGERRDDTLWTFPLGFGMKFPIRRWLAARWELADQLAIGNSSVSTQHNLTLTYGLEWRFGAHPRSYYPWNPSRHIW